MSKTFQVWDLPTRLTHWMLAAAFIASWVSSLEEHLMKIHVYTGSLFLGLALFRIWRGFLGPIPYRFHSFLKPFNEVFGYVFALFRGQAPRFAGHNPAGGWSVVGLLTLGAVEGGLGLAIMGGEEHRIGPLRGLIDTQTGDLLSEIHEIIAILLLLGVVAHLTGVLVESLAHKENLAAAMVHGHKLPGVGAEEPMPSHWGLALFLIGMIGVGSAYYFKIGLAPAPETLAMLKSNPKQAWVKECGDCHFAFPPSLLPVRSWNLLFTQTAKHFGENLDLDQEILDPLQKFATKNAAEQLDSEAAYKILHSLAPQEVPLRITETPYWIKKHAEISKTVWNAPQVGGPVQCPACHIDADTGTFDDDAIHIPLQLKSPLTHKEK
ncbi:MAG: cytochrome b/b6 domain-containing protein [Magnetococcus sp. DMHC-6]